MLLYCDQVWSLAIITLLVRWTVATGGDFMGSKVESSSRSAESSIDSDWNGLVGDVRGELDTFEQAVKTELSKALNDSNGVLAQFNMAYQTTPPISAQLLTSGFESNVTIGLYCESCPNASQPTAFDFASNYSGWHSSWLGFALDSFDAQFELDVDLSAEANGDLTLSLLKKSAMADGVVVEVDFQLYLVADASASMSFTAGLNLSLTEPAAIMMPALDPVVQLNESQRIGFAPENFLLTPIFNASMPQLDFSMQISLRTVFSVTVEEINIGALYLDLPAFNLTVNTLTDATSNCQTPPTGTPSDEIYAELIHLEGTLVAELSYEMLDGDVTNTIDKWTIWDALDKCYAFLPGLGSLGVVPDSSSSALLTAAPVTTCTTGGTTTLTGTAAVGAAVQSLSTGAKVGIAIGLLAALTLTALTAWYVSRATLRHSLPPSEPRSHNIFSRATRHSATKFSPLSPSPSAWQPSAYGGAYGPSEEAESQQQQQWQTAEKAPVVSTRETTSPAAPYLSIGDDDRTPAPRGEEPDVGTGDVGTQPARYESFRTGQAEVEGLLHTGPRPVVQRKEVSRKDVPRYGAWSGRGGV